MGIEPHEIEAVKAGTARLSWPWQPCSRHGVLPEYHVPVLIAVEGSVRLVTLRPSADAWGDLRPWLFATLGANPLSFALPDVVAWMSIPDITYTPAAGLEAPAVDEVTP